MFVPKVRLLSISLLICKFRPSQKNMVLKIYGNSSTLGLLGGRFLSGGSCGGLFNDQLNYIFYFPFTSENSPERFLHGILKEVGKYFLPKLNVAFASCLGLVPTYCCHEPAFQSEDLKGFSVKKRSVSALLCFVTTHQCSQSHLCPQETVQKVTIFSTRTCKVM